MSTRTAQLVALINNEEASPQERAEAFGSLRHEAPEQARSLAQNALASVIPELRAKAAAVLCSLRDCESLQAILEMIRRDAVSVVRVLCFADVVRSIALFDYLHDKFHDQSATIVESLLASFEAEEDDWAKGEMRFFLHDLLRSKTPGGYGDDGVLVNAVRRLWVPSGGDDDLVAG
jgi:hypothetical protein